MGEGEYQGEALPAKPEEVCLQIIALAGDAKSKVYEALKAAIDRDYRRARGMLAEAEARITQARQIQHSLLTSEARGEGMKPSILLTHAMDILITAESENNLASHVLGLCESASMG